MAVKKIAYAAVLLLLGSLMLAPLTLWAKDKEDEGKVWLATHTEASQINVAGVWFSDDWGTVILHQAKDSREITGNADNCQIEGVVSGKSAFLVLLRADAKGKAYRLYTAQLSPVEDDTLKGEYVRGVLARDKGGNAMVLKRDSKAASVVPTAVSGELAHVVVYRDHYHNCPQVKAAVNVDGKVAAELQNGRYLTLNLRPGVHLIGTSKIGHSGSQTLQLELAPGSTSYVHFEFPSAWVCTIDLLKVSASEAMQVISRTKPNDAKRIMMPDMVSLSEIQQ